jgi:hypothetical protein
MVDVLQFVRTHTAGPEHQLCEIENKITKIINVIKKFKNNI